MTGFEWTMIVAAVAILGFLWRLSEKVSGVEVRLQTRIAEVETRLGERIAKVEGLLEGLRLRPEEPTRNP